MKLFGNERGGGEHSPERAAGSAGVTESGEALAEETADETAEAVAEAETELPEAEIETSELRSDAPEDGAETADAASAAAAKKKTRRRAAIIAGVVVLALLAAVAAYFVWEDPLKPAEQETPPPPDTAETAPPDDAPAPPDDGGEDFDPNEGALALPMTAGRRDGVFTFLLVGTDKASNSTDTIIVASFDTKAHAISCTSIPRDTLINISWASTPKKINAVYPGYVNTYNRNPARYAEDYETAEDYGVYGLREHIRNLLGFYVDYYVLVDIQAVEDAVDAIGGIWFDAGPEDRAYFDPAQDLTIYIPAGYQLLDGENAVKLCRFRYGYAGGDLDRIGVQQEVLKALADQLISANSIPHLSELIDIVTREVNTDLSAANIAWLARQFLACSMDDVAFQTLPLVSSNAGVNDVSLVGADVTAWLEMLNASVSPFEDDVTPQNVDILSYNGYGGVYATTGSIAGGLDSFYCLSCTAKTGQTIWHAPGAHLPDEEEAEEPESPAEPETPDAPPAEPEQPSDPPPPSAEPEQPPEPESPTIETIIVTDPPA